MTPGPLTTTSCRKHREENANCRFLPIYPTLTKPAKKTKNPRKYQTTMYHKKEKKVKERKKETVYCGIANRDRF